MTPGLAPLDLALAVPLGGALGFLIGLTGVGGGALVAPALYVLLGRSYGEAVALSLVYSLFTKVLGAVQHVRQGTVLWKVTLLFGLAGIPGAILGSRAVYTASAASHRVLPFLMGAVLLLVAALILVEMVAHSVVPWERPFSPEKLTPTGILAVGLFQFTVGVLMGLTSVGSGSLVILWMLYLYRMPTREIVGSNLVIALIMVVPAGVTHYVAGGVDWRLLSALLLGSLAGASLGARAAMVLPDRTLKLAIAGLIALGALATMAKAW